MTTPEQKELVATQLRVIAGLTEPLLDGITPGSRHAWQCPAADGFEAETGVEVSRLERIANALRTVSASLEAEASAQRIALAAEAAAAEAAAAALRNAGRPAPPATPPPNGPPRWRGGGA